MNVISSHISKLRFKPYVLLYSGELEGLWKVGNSRVFAPLASLMNQHDFNTGLCDTKMRFSASLAFV